MTSNLPIPTPLETSGEKRDNNETTSSGKGSAHENRGTGGPGGGVARGGHGELGKPVVAGCIQEVGVSRGAQVRRGGGLSRHKSPRPLSVDGGPRGAGDGGLGRGSERAHSPVHRRRSCQKGHRRATDRALELSEVRTSREEG